MLMVESHGRTGGLRLQHVAALAAIAVAVLCLWLIQWRAVENRRLPQMEAGALRIVVVPSQRDAYRMCAGSSIRGATVVQLGKFSNLQYWEPEYLGKSAPFPIRTFDVRPEYEKGLQSHNWLYIASTNGLVRQVVSVLPQGEFQRMVPALDADFGLGLRRGGYAGF